MSCDSNCRCVDTALILTLSTSNIVEHNCWNINYIIIKIDFSYVLNFFYFVIDSFIFIVNYGVTGTPVQNRSRNGVVFSLTLSAFLSPHPGRETSLNEFPSSKKKVIEMLNLFYQVTHLTTFIWLKNALN